MPGTAHAGQQSPAGYEEEATVYPAWGFLVEVLVEAEKPYTKKDQAIKFKKMTDQRVPEHAPFQVYGLYSLIHL